MLKLLNHLVSDEDDLYAEAKALNIEFEYDRYIVVSAEITNGSSIDMSSGQDTLGIYSSSIAMAKEIISRHAPCSVVSIDLKHFVVVFYFCEDTPIAETMDLITEALENALCHQFRGRRYGSGCLFHFTAYSPASPCGL